MIILVEGSSIFNIDFAAGIFSGVHDSQPDITILLNDKPHISKIKQHRKYISRLSFPLTKWIYTPGTESKSKDHVWRMEHYPAEMLNYNNYQVQFEEISANFTDQLKGYLKEEKLSIISDRFKELISLASKIKNRKKNPWHASLYASVIGLIYEKTLRRSFLVQRMGGFKELDSTPFNRVGILINELFQELKSKPKGEYRFIKGGYIEVVSINGRVSKCDIVSLTEPDKMHLRGKNDKSGITFSLHKFKTGITRTNSKVYSLACRGPIQMLILRRFGVLAHLPWYAFAEAGESTTNPCYEFISPISVSDVKRVSEFSGGKGIRLHPSGYSLFDYECEESLGFIRGILKDKSLSFEQLYDWRFLADNFPVTNEKLAEHQREIIPYLQTKLKLLKKRYRNEGLTKEDKVLALPEEMNFVEHGRYLTEVFAYIEYLKTVTSADNLIQLKPLETSLITGLGWLDGTKFDSFKLFNNLDSVVRYCIAKLENLGFDKSKSAAWLNKWNSQLIAYKKFRYFNIEKTDLDNYLSNKHITSILPLLRLLLEYYYSFASFAVSTLFKANIFTCYFLFGPEKYHLLIKEIFDKRGKTAMLKFRPEYFQKI